MPATSWRHNLINDLANGFRWHIGVCLFTVKKRLFPRYDYLAGETVRTILHRQSNIACHGKPLDVWFPVTIA